MFDATENTYFKSKTLPRSSVDTGSSYAICPLLLKGFVWKLLYINNKLVQLNWVYFKMVQTNHGKAAITRNAKISFRWAFYGFSWFAWWSSVLHAHLKYDKRIKKKEIAKYFVYERNMFLSSKYLIRIWCQFIGKFHKTLSSAVGYRKYVNIFVSIKIDSPVMDLLRRYDLVLLPISNKRSLYSSRWPRHFFPSLSLDE